jgi:hypothetical protein
LTVIVSAWLNREKLQDFCGSLQIGLRKHRFWLG